MSAVVTRIAKAILGDQQGGIDTLEDVEAAVKLVIKGIHACDLFVAMPLQVFVVRPAITAAELED